MTQVDIGQSSRSEPSLTSTPRELARRRLERRAVEAAIWGMPLVNVDAMRQAYLRDAGASYHDIVYWSAPSDWRNQVTTPNNTTQYVLFFVSLAWGAVVVEVPPADEIALYGTLVDAWNVPLLDVGSEGSDRGQGARYLLLPPDFQGVPPEGYTPVPARTNTVYSLLRLITSSRSEEEREKAVAYLQRLRVYPLAEGDRSREPRFIDLAGKSFEAIAPHDASFYDSLARMVEEEPVRESDLAILGQFRTLGIGKGVHFAPDDAMRELLGDAIAEAHALMKCDFARAGFLWWRDRQWRFLVDDSVVKTRTTFLVPDQALLLDERAATWFAAFAPVADPQTANLYLKTHVDGHGAELEGAHTYRLHLPANVPASQFWSVTVYDADTAGFIREAQVVGLDSLDERLQKNDDGSIDLFFAPTPPPGKETNWIATVPDRAWFSFFRIYGPQKGALERSWVLDDIEEIAI